MAESFDPYHKWLGIPPPEQPPNHYRLLGVTLFESDPDVISSAADRQMTHVRTFQIGLNSAVSQRILNEISAARLCLLDARRREAYDVELGARRTVPHSGSSAARPPVAKPLARPAQPPMTAPLVTRSLAGRQRAAPRRRQKTVMSIAVACGLLMFTLIVAYVLSSGTNVQSVPTKRPRPGGDDRPPIGRKGSRPSPDTRDKKANGGRASRANQALESDVATTVKESPQVHGAAWTHGAVMAIDCDRSSQIEGEEAPRLSDLSGHGNDATVFGAELVEGKVGKGIRFGEAEGFLECADADSLNSIQALTVAIWAKMDVTGGTHDLVSKDDWEGGPTRGYVLRLLGPDHFNFTVGAGGWRNADSSGGMQVQQWYHLVGAYDVKAIRLYIDGVERANSSFEGTIEPSRYKLRIGSCQFSPERRFLGVVDEVAVWDRALSSEEIRQLYEYSNQGQSYCRAIGDAAPKVQVREIQ